MKLHIVCRALGAVALISGVSFGDLANTETTTREVTKTTTTTATVVPKKEAKIGARAPEFTLADSKGKKYSLKDFQGKVVVLEWLNHGCPFVQKHYETNNMQSLQTYAKDKGAVWLSVISSAPGKQGEGVLEPTGTAQKTAASAVLIDSDGAVGHRYGAETTPAMYVVGKTGTLTYMGAIDDKPTTDKADVKKAKNYVREALDATLADQPVKMASTKSYGCSIKYNN